jgi:hypothetical protein
MRNVLTFVSIWWGCLSAGIALIGDRDRNPDTVAERGG